MLTDKLKEYSKSGIYPFHMPGHKRNRIGDLPYELDVTEIDGFDNLHDPGGIIREIERKAEKLFRAKRAFRKARLHARERRNGRYPSLDKSRHKGGRKGDNSAQLPQIGLQRG